jgi:hypothetical protein
MDERAFHRMNYISSMHFRSSGYALRKWAGHRRYHDILRLRSILGTIRIPQTKHIAGEFDQRVLEPSAGSQIGQVPPPGELDAAQHAARTPKRTSGRSPKSIEVSQEVLSIPAFQRFRGEPARFNVEAEPGSGVKQGRFRRPMGMLLGIKVA